MEKYQKALATVGLVIISLTFSFTLLAVLFNSGRLENLFKLLELVLSWEVVAGGFVFGGGQALIRAIRDRSTPEHE